MKDLYDALEIPKSASDKDIRNAYRRLAMKFHPDKNKSEGATQRFQEISAAYEVLGNSNTRAQYDRGEYGENINVPDRTTAEEIFATFARTYLSSNDPALALLVAGVHLFNAYQGSQSPENQQREELNNNFIDALQSKHLNEQEKIRALNRYLAQGADVNYGKPEIFGMQFQSALFANSSLTTTALEIALEKNMSEAILRMILDHPQFKPTARQLTCAIKMRKPRVVTALISKGIQPLAEHLKVAIETHDGDSEIINILLANDVAANSEHLDMAINKNIPTLIDKFKASGIIPTGYMLRQHITAGRETLALRFMQHGAKPNTEHLRQAIVNNLKRAVDIMCGTHHLSADGLVVNVNDKRTPVLAYLAEHKDKSMLNALARYGVSKRAANDYMRKDIRTQKILSALLAVVIASVAYGFANLEDEIHIFNGKELHRPSKAFGPLFFIGMVSALLMCFCTCPAKRKAEENQQFLTQHCRR